MEGIPNLFMYHPLVTLCIIIISNNSLPNTPQGSGPYFEPSTGLLVLSEAMPGDSGFYTCTATNMYGSGSASTEIVIIRNRGTISLLCETCTSTMS